MDDFSKRKVIFCVLYELFHITARQFHNATVECHHQRSQQQHGQLARFVQGPAERAGSQLLPGDDPGLHVLSGAGDAVHDRLFAPETTPLPYRQTDDPAEGHLSDDYARSGRQESGQHAQVSAELYVLQVWHRADVHNAGGADWQAYGLCGADLCGLVVCAVSGGCGMQAAQLAVLPGVYYCADAAAVRGSGGDSTVFVCR